MKSFKAISTLMLLVVAFCMQSCTVNAQKTKVASRDNPTLLPTAVSTISPEVEQFLGDSLADILLTADVVKAYHLEEDAKDSSPQGFYGFKVVDKIERLPDAQVKTLKDMLKNKENYIITNVRKRCEFSPNIGFLFQKGDQSFSLLLAFNCDVLTYLQAVPVTTQNFDPAHTKYTEFGNLIFPNAYTNYLTTATTTTPADRPTNPIFTPVVVPVDSSNTNGSSAQPRKKANKKSTKGKSPKMMPF